MLSKLSIFTLGGVQIQRSGEPVTSLSAKKAEALLIYLASTRRPQPREVLAELLWDERSQSQSMANLRGVLTNLRQVLGDYLVITRETAGINPEAEVWLDAARLENSLVAARKSGQPDAAMAEQLATTLELYKGEFLQGFSVFDCRGFEEWATRERERLHHRVVEAYSSLVEYEASQMEYQPGIAYASRLLELDPLNERAHRQMMQLLEASGQRAAALLQYETCQKLLRGELRVEPEAETRQLYDQLRAGTPISPPPSSLQPAKSPTLPRHNLPVQLTSFIGREREIREIKQLLDTTHLLTLTGTGGTGKTRLALQIAAELVDDYPAGVWLVELAPLRDPSQVEPTVATVLGVHEKPGRPLPELLVDYLRDKHLLLILDNCEHVLEACAQLANLLLCSTPELKILATSRVHLNLAGEMTYLVPPLALPEPGRAVTVHALAKYEAVRLFIERAIAMQPSFSVTNENAPAVAQICTHLDGIPLAIELAAARIRHLSPDQISSRLDDRFNLLIGGSRAALPRQQTLRAALDWSYDLLSMAEGTLFNRLAVFAGSFSLEAVEAICAGEIGGESPMPGISPSQALDVLGALVDHSLVSLQERNAENRYILLETVRQYALEKLQASGELPGLQDRHLAYYLKLAQEGETHFYRGRPTWMNRFETEYDNFRAAMEQALATNLESSILFLKFLDMFVSLTHRNVEAYNWSMRILANTGTWPAGKMRAEALCLAGGVLWPLGEFQQGQVLLEAGLDMARELDDKNLIETLLYELACGKFAQDDWAPMRMYGDQLLAISQELGDKGRIQDALWLLGESLSQSGDNQAGRMYLEKALEMARKENFPKGIAWAVLSLARIASQEGDNSSAKRYYMECIQIRREMGFRSGLAFPLYRLGQLVLQEDDAAQARVLFEEMLSVYVELKNVDGQGIYPLAMAGVAAQSGQDERAARLFGAAEANAERTDNVMSDISHQVFDPLVAIVRERLGETEFNRLWSEGRKLTLEQALELAQRIG